MRWGKRWIYVIDLIVVCLLMLCAGCDTSQGKIDFTKTQEHITAAEESPEKPLRIAFASVISPKETRQAYQHLVDYISQNQHCPAVLLQRRTYEELNTLMSNGDADVAFFSTGAYSAYHGKTPIEMLAMGQTNGSIYYQTYIIAAADSGITSFDQLRGKIFAFTDPMSYSGHLAIDFLLLDQGTSPEIYFKRFFYTYNHDKSIWAVANHLADAASIDSQIYDFVMQTNPQLLEKIRIVDILPEAPTGPIVMRSDLPGREKDALRHLFYNMDQNPALREVLRHVIIDKFIAPAPALYEELRHKYNLRSHSLEA